MMMSIDVENHNEAVITKVVICAGLALVAAMSAVNAGSRASVSVRSWCPPVRPVCPVSPQIVYGPWFPCNCPALCNWFALPAGFRNISTGFVYGEPSVYRVPEPVILEQPVVQYPGTAFRWRY